MLPPVASNLVLVAVLAAVLTGLWVRRPRPPYWPDLPFLPLAALLYVLGDALARSASSPPTLAYTLRYAGAYLGSVAFFVLAVRVTRFDGERRISGSLVDAAWYVFAVSFAVLVTNPWHHYYLVPRANGTTAAGPLWMPVFHLYAWALWTPAGIGFARLALRGRHVATRRSAAFLLAGMLLLLVPIVWGVFWGSPGFDPVLVGISVTGTVMALGAYRANLFHLDGGALARTFENSLDPLLVAQGDGQVLYANAAATALFSESPGDLFEAVSARFRAPLGQVTGGGWVRGQLQAPQELQDRTLPPLFLTAEEPPRWFSFHPLRLPPRRGRPELLALRLHDFTAERQQQLALLESEERFRGLVEQAPLGIVACDREGGVYVVNQRLLDLFDSPDDLLVGANLLESASIQAAGFAELIARALADGESVTAECTRRTRGSHDLELRVHLQPLRAGAAGRPEPRRHRAPALLLLVEDVTEQRQAERERRAFERRILETQKLESLGVLAGGIAHDFNNALTALKGHAELGLRLARAGQNGGEHFAPILRVADEAAELVAQILAYSGRAPARRVALDLDELVSSMEPLLSSVVARQVPLEFEVEPDLPPVLADVGQTRQVLMNLITNAVEAQQDRPGTVTVAIGRGEAGSEAPEGLVLDAGAVGRPHVYLRVSDRGCGMDAATQARIFEPFFSTRGAGRGLGLAATIGIVRAHGGAMSLVSRAGNGTTVTVLLPIEGREHETVEGRSPVLVVDPDDHVRSLARLALEGTGRSVLTASTAQMACLTIERQESLAAVVLDEQFVSADLLSVLRSRRPGLPMILTGGNARSDAENLGPGTVLLRKPFTASELVGKLEHVCGRASLRPARAAGG